MVNSLNDPPTIGRTEATWRSAGHRRLWHGLFRFGVSSAFSIDIVKIDQSFVSSLDEDEQAVPLVRSIISVADALGLDTVAEGVETLTQLETLRRLGCQVAQGYHFSRALSIDRLIDYLDEEAMLDSTVPPS